MKRCSRCGCTKPLDEFYRDSNPRNKTGRHSQCIDCTKVAATEWLREHPRDPAKERERLRAFRKANPSKDREYGRRWREKNRERALALARERGAKWRREKPESKIASQARRRTRTADVTEIDIEYMAILRRDPCSYCGTAAGVVDHIVPLYQQGLHGWENLTAACRRCNSSKGTKSLLAFLSQ